jgi:hypothetical protein
VSEQADLQRSVEQLLDGLEMRPTEEAARTSYLGKAVSRSETEVHFATEHGLLAIPLDVIEEVLPMDRDSETAWIAVSDATKVKALLRPEDVSLRPYPWPPEPIPWPGTGDGPIHWPSRWDPLGPVAAGKEMEYVCTDCGTTTADGDTGVDDHSCHWVQSW